MFPGKKIANHNTESKLYCIYQYTFCWSVTFNSSNSLFILVRHKSLFDFDGMQTNALCIFMYIKDVVGDGIFFFLLSLLSLIATQSMMLLLLAVIQILDSTGCTFYLF